MDSVLTLSVRPLATIKDRDDAHFGLELNTMILECTSSRQSESSSDHMTSNGPITLEVKDRGQPCDETPTSGDQTAPQDSQDGLSSVNTNTDDETGTQKGVADDKSVEQLTAAVLLLKVSEENSTENSEGLIQLTERSLSDKQDTTTTTDAQESTEESSLILEEDLTIPPTEVTQEDVSVGTTTEEDSATRDRPPTAATEGQTDSSGSSEEADEDEQLTPKGPMQPNNATIYRNNLAEPLEKKFVKEDGNDYEGNAILSQGVLYLKVKTPSGVPPASKGTRKRENNEQVYTAAQYRRTGAEPVENDEGHRLSGEESLEWVPKDDDKPVENEENRMSSSEVLDWVAYQRCKQDANFVQTEPRENVLPDDLVDLKPTSAPTSPEETEALIQDLSDDHISPEAFAAYPSPPSSDGQSSPQNFTTYHPVVIPDPVFGPIADVMALQSPLTDASIYSPSSSDYSYFCEGGLVSPPSDHSKPSSPEEDLGYTTTNSFEENLLIFERLIKNDLSQHVTSMDSIATVTPPTYMTRPQQHPAPTAVTIPESTVLNYTPPQQRPSIYHLPCNQSSSSSSASYIPASPAGSTHSTASSAQDRSDSQRHSFSSETSESHQATKSTASLSTREKLSKLVKQKMDAKKEEERQRLEKSGGTARPQRPRRQYPPILPALEGQRKKSSKEEQAMMTARRMVAQIPDSELLRVDDQGDSMIHRFVREMDTEFNDSSDEGTEEGDCESEEDEGVAEPPDGVESQESMMTKVVVKGVHLTRAFLERLKRCDSEQQGSLQLINKPNRKGQTPLLLACLLKSPELAKVLLVFGADPNLKTKRPRANGTEQFYHAPLHYVCEKAQGLLGVLEVLLQHGRTDVNITNQDMETPLHCAIRVHGRPSDDGKSVLDSREVVTRLLQRGAQLKPGPNDQNPLHYLAAVELRQNPGDFLAFFRYVIDKIRSEPAQREAAGRIKQLLEVNSGMGTVLHIVASKKFSDEKGRDVVLEALRMLIHDLDVDPTCKDKLDFRAKRYVHCGDKVIMDYLTRENKNYRRAQNRHNLHKQERELAGPQASPSHQVPLSPAQGSPSHQVPSQESPSYQVPAQGSLAQQQMNGQGSPAHQNIIGQGSPAHHQIIGQASPSHQVPLSPAQGSPSHQVPSQGSPSYQVPAQGSLAQQQMNGQGSPAHQNIIGQGSPAHHQIIGQGSPAQLLNRNQPSPGQTSKQVSVAQQQWQTQASPALQQVPGRCTTPSPYTESLFSPVPAQLVQSPNPNAYLAIHQGDVPALTAAQVYTILGLSMANNNTATVTMVSTQGGPALADKLATQIPQFGQGCADQKPPIYQGSVPNGNFGGYPNGTMNPAQCNTWVYQNGAVDRVAGVQHDPAMIGNQYANDIGAGQFGDIGLFEDDEWLLPCL